MEKEKIRGKIKDALHFYYKRKHLYKTSTEDGLYRTIIFSILKDTLYTLSKPDFTSNLSRFKANIKNGMDFKKALDSFTDFLDTNKTLKQKTETILKTPKRRTITYTGWDKNIGKRGEGKKFDILKDAEMILLNPEKVIKIRRAKINKTKLFQLIRSAHHNQWDEKSFKVLNYSDEIVKLVNLYMFVLYNVAIEFLKEWKCDDKNQTKIVMNFLPKDSSLYTEIKSKGKNITKQNIEAYFKKFREHLWEKTPTRSSYGFSYKAWLFGKIYTLLDLDRETRKEEVKQQIKSLLEKCPSDSFTIVKELDELFPSQSTLDYKSLLKNQQGN